jgi:hypothetical protein
MASGEEILYMLVGVLLTIIMACIKNGTAILLKSPCCLLDINDEHNEHTGSAPDSDEDGVTV